MFKLIVKVILLICVGCGALFMLHLGFPQANHIAFNILNIPIAYTFVGAVLAMGLAAKYIKV